MTKRLFAVIRARGPGYDNAQPLEGPWSLWLGSLADP